MAIASKETKLSASCRSAPHYSPKVAQPLPISVLTDSSTLAFIESNRWINEFCLTCGDVILDSIFRSSESEAGTKASLSGHPQKERLTLFGKVECFRQMSSGKCGRQSASRLRPLAGYIKRELLHSRQPHDIRLQAPAKAGAYRDSVPSATNTAWPPTRTSVICRSRAAIEI